MDEDYLGTSIEHSERELLALEREYDAFRDQQARDLIESGWMDRSSDESEASENPFQDEESSAMSTQTELEPATFLWAQDEASRRREAAILASQPLPLLAAPVPKPVPIFSAPHATDEEADAEEQATQVAACQEADGPLRSVGSPVPYLPLTALRALVVIFTAFSLFASLLSGEEQPHACHEPQAPVLACAPVLYVRGYVRVACAPVLYVRGYVRVVRRMVAPRPAWHGVPAPEPSMSVMRGKSTRCIAPVHGEEHAPVFNADNSGSADQNATRVDEECGEQQEPHFALERRRSERKVRFMLNPSGHVMMLFAMRVA